MMKLSPHHSSPANNGDTARHSVMMNTIPFRISLSPFFIAVQGDCRPPAVRQKDPLHANIRNAATLY
ncbi:MAG: hypothetical protein U5N56_03665 [Candidatus Marinimicrobia bacterium]|nr:hypothetical protein [Candidatus Neomarinimicrobiota bacterium]